MRKITPFLWFDSEAEEAMNYYLSIFKNGRVVSVNRANGRVLTVAFELEGQRFMGLNAGPKFKFNEAISFQVMCETQEEIDRYWSRLSAGGDEKAQQCGWLKDKYGLSWQVVPAVLPDLLDDHDRVKAGRVMKALLQMKKLDIKELKQAHAG